LGSSSNTNSNSAPTNTNTNRNTPQTRPNPTRVHSLSNLPQESNMGNTSATQQRGPAHNPGQGFWQYGPSPQLEQAVRNKNGGSSESAKPSNTSSKKVQNRSGNVHGLQHEEDDDKTKYYNGNSTQQE